jgi:hypothetical protein
MLARKGRFFCSSIFKAGRHGSSAPTACAIAGLCGPHVQADFTQWNRRYRDQFPCLALMSRQASAPAAVFHGCVIA